MINSERHQASLKVTRLVPILYVEELLSERDFYRTLGFEITYEGPEFPGFIAMGTGPVEFAIEHHDSFSKNLPPNVLGWQFGVENIDDAKKTLEGRGITFEEEQIRPSEDWRYRVLHVTTPNGYHLLLEGPRE
jgi:hypothetical protein